MAQSFDDVNWSDEMAKAVKTGGKALLRFASYLLNIIMTIGLVGIITGTAVGITFLAYVNKYLDTSVEGFDLLASDKSLTTMVAYLDSDGNTVEMEDQRLSASENRVWVAYEDFNPYIAEAFKAVEDKRFDTHNGVDWYRTIGCTLYYFTGSTKGGGSTITQQLIKNITGNDDVTIQRKVSEIFQALALEKRYDKTEILEMYLNNIYLSENCYGIGAAAYTYFGKEVKDLTLIESAAIASITQNPYKWDPILNPEANARRRDYVLQCMYDQGRITREEYLSAYGHELKLYEGDEETISSIHSWYVDAAQQEAVNLIASTFGYTKSVAEKALLTGGYTIVTAMDPEIQKIIEDYYENDANWQFVDNSPIQPESSFIVIDPQNGNVLGLVGARGKKTANLLLNYATQTKRPAGSSLKPVSVYAPALEYGAVTYGTVLDDVPVNFGEKKINAETGEISYTIARGYPKNSPDKYRGLTTVNEGIKVSINTIAWRTLEKLGISNSYQFLTEKVGISTLVNNYVTSSGAIYTDCAMAPLSMGQLTYGVTLKELTSAYQIFANGGIYNEERIVLQILDADGNILIENEPKSSIVLSAQNASLMTKMLQSVVSGGTAEKIKLDKLKDGNAINCAGKTGTTEKAQDWWFIGYTPYYLAGVWFGYSMPRSLAKFSTAKTTLKAWDTIMTQITAKFVERAKAGAEELKTFSLSAGIVAVKYCKDSGKLCTDACRADPRGHREEIGYFVAGTEPTEYCDVHVLVDYDTAGKCVAVNGCAESGAKIKQVGLLNILREFPVNVKIIDAQYTMQILPEGYSFSGLTEYDPYYKNLLKAGTYCGYSEEGKIPFNRVCPIHSISPNILGE